VGLQHQGSFLQAESGRKKKPTRRDKFLAEMEAVVPLARPSRTHLQYEIKDRPLPICLA
jgi:hypothetical protein